MTRQNSCLAACPVTPEDVLAVLRDWHRQQLQFDPEAQPDIALDFSSTVAEWRLACDLLSWQPLARALGECWCIDASAAEWRSVLEPAGLRTLWEVCSFIAARGTRMEVLPTRLLGACCVSGGMFEAIRGLLARAGADVGRLRPSDAIGPYLYRYPQVFLGPIGGLAPGRLPAVAVHARLETALQILFVVGLIAAAACDYFDQKRPAMACLAIGFIAIAITWAVPCSRMEFPAIVTFRDLVECLLAQEVHPEEGRSARF